MADETKIPLLGMTLLELKNLAAQNNLSCQASGSPPK